MSGSSSLIGGATAFSLAPLRWLLACLLAGAGLLVLTLPASAEGALSRLQLADLRQNRVLFDLDHCGLPGSADAETTPLRDFQLDGVGRDLVIATSTRPYHLILSYVLQIILRESQRIGRVVVRPLDPRLPPFDQRAVLAQLRSKEIDRIADAPTATYPDAMINAEVWRDVGYGAGYGFSHSVYYAGVLATQGLFGWWIPRVWMNRRPKDDPAWDHYLILTMKDKVRSLSIPATELDPVIPPAFSCATLRRDAQLGARFRDWDCDGGVLRSPACRRDPSVRCATLLAGDPFQWLGRGHLAQLLSEQIEGLAGALVNLAFLGSELDGFVLRRLNVTVSAMKGTLFFNWAPNVLTACDSPGAEHLTLETPFEAKSQPRHRLSCVSTLLL